MEKDRLPVIVKRIDRRAKMPFYASEGAAGADISALLESSVTIPPGGRALIATGLSMEIPTGYEGQIRPRSGLAVKFGVTVMNSPGTIDSDYRGELRIALVNLGEAPFVVNDGDRIAQLVIARYAKAEFAETAALSETVRSAAGFGSTGI